MDAGKSTTAASTVRGLTRAGATVCAGKLTGTAAGKDVFLMLDSGAAQVMDFTSVGHASTAGCSEDELVGIYQTIWSSLAAFDPDFIVLEIADGLVQRETNLLLSWLRRSCPPLMVICAVGDALGLVGAVHELDKLRISPVGISGCVTRTPLSSREAQAMTELPVWTRDDLADPTIRDILSLEQAAPVVSALVSSG